MQLARKILVLVFTGLTLLLLLTFKASFPVWLSFAVNGLVLFILFIYHIFYEKTFSPFLTAFLVFNYLFLFLAPIVQIGSFYGEKAPQFAQYFPYDEKLAIYANLLIVLFNLTFFIVYTFLKRNLKPVQIKYADLKNKYSVILIFSLLIISFLIFAFTFPVVLDEIIKPYWIKLNVSKIYVLIINKTLLFLPFAGIILSKHYLDKSGKKNNNYYFVLLMMLVFFLILFWFKNPLTEKRNALGPLYITLIYIFKPKWLNNNTKMMLFLFFSMVIIFPLVAIITHTAFSLTQLLQNPALLFATSDREGFLHIFHTLHYDAFSNIMATIDYVGHEGLAWGRQLLGVLGFYIPRSLWTEKPFGTGQLVGQYLMDRYHFVFSNLSNPLVSEGFINFGVLGVILMAVLLAYFVRLMLSWINSAHYSKKILAFYFSLHMIFLLRGDLLNGVAYFAGVVIAVLLIPFLIERFIFLIHSKSQITDARKQEA